MTSLREWPVLANRPRVLFVGIDDTDTLDSPGTNQLARHLIRRVAERFRPVLLVRHQLLEDPRVPCTSKNGSASIWLEPREEGASGGPLDLDWLFRECREEMLSRFVPGSDPGLCLTDDVPEALRHWGRRCKQELVTQQEARELAAACGIRLEGLGGTNGGIIGSLAAIGLASTGNDGRVVVNGDWPDDLDGPQPLERLNERGVVVRELESGELVGHGMIDAGKHLRPNLRGGNIVLFVRRPEAPGDDEWEAVRLK